MFADMRAGRNWGGGGGGVGEVDLAYKQPTNKWTDYNIS